MHRPVGTWLLVLVALPPLAACGGEPDEPGDAEAEAADVAAARDADVEAGAEDADAGPAPEPLDVGELSPTFSVEGDADRMPERVLVEFDRVIAAPDQDRPGSATAFEVEPEVPGSLRFTSRYELAFEPEEAFRPSTAYELTLRKLEVRVPEDERPEGADPNRVLEPSSPWTHDFETTPFRLVELSPATSAGSASTAHVDLVFSARVEADAVGEHASWELDGSPVEQVSYASAESPHVVRAELEDPALADPETEGPLSFELREGLPYDDEITAPAASETVEVRTGSPMHVRAVLLKEGANGFYLHVVCDDQAAGGDDYYYDSDSGEHYEVSRRCEPDPEVAEEFIELSPELDWRISPAEGGFRLHADFERRGYTLRVAKGLTTLDGGVLTESGEYEVEVPARSELVAMPGDGRYIPRKMWRNLPVRHRNVEELELKVRRVPRDNLVFWMSGDDDDADERTSTRIVDTTVPVEGPPDEATTTWFDVREHVGEPKPGVYEIQLASSDSEAVARLAVTETNLVVKRAAPRPDGEWSPEVRVWTLDMETNAARSGVEVEALRKSGDVLARCETGDDGGCRLTLPEDPVDPSAPFAVVATKGEDVTFLEYEDLKSPVQNAEVHGEPYRSERPYRASLYTERGVYRPGGTAHVVGVLRDRDHGAPKAGMPVTLAVRDARGRLVREAVRKTNEAGVVTLDQSFGDLASTGQWRVEMNVADESVTTHEFSVEEFVPERMDVEAAPRESDLLLREQPRIDVHAEYLFGASAKGSPVEMTCRLEPTGFEPPRNSGYEYGPVKLDGDFEPVSHTPVEGRIGEDDTATLSCPGLERAGAFPTTARVVATVEVQEAGSGRTTEAQATARAHPERYYLGLKPRTEEVEAGETYTMEGRVVDWEGKPSSAVDEVRLRFAALHGEWTRYYDSQRGRMDWKQHLRPVREGARTVEVDDEGRFDVEFTPRDVEDGYLVRAVAGQAETAVQLDSRRRHYLHRRPRGTRDRTPRPNAPKAMPVEVSEPIGVGEPATATFTAPYAGRVLLTVETHEVLRHEWREVEAGEHEWTFELDGYHPNVYVGAFLLKDPHLESEESYLPGRAFGMQSVRVRSDPYEHDLRLGVPESIEPASTLSVEVDAGAGAGGGAPEDDGPRYAAVAAVDQGILSLTDFELPDPLRDVLAKRALGVTTFDTVGWSLSLPPRGQSSSQGGGAPGGQQEGRMMAIEPVALWSGLKRLPSDGTKTFELDVPRYRGELRVMAHVFSPKRIGRASRAVDVVDPLPLQTTTPRFLTAGDEVQIPVFVTNMTDRKREIAVELAAETIERGGTGDEPGPAITVENDRLQTIEVAPDESGTVVFAAKAERLAGAGRISVTARSGEETSRTESIIPFRAAGPREREVKQLAVEEGTTDLAGEVEGWKPTSEETSFWLTGIEDGRSFDKAKRLLGYPHGCVEQTTSTTRPLLVVSELLQVANPGMMAQDGAIDDMVQHGIDRVLSMQTPSGGFGYWPGATRPHPWGTTYAAHMLLDARDQGYDVPKRRLDDALDWLANRASEGLDGGNRYTHLGTNGEAYTHYVLARSGRGNEGAVADRVDELPDDPSGKKRETAYLLKAALYEAGDRRYEEDLRSPGVGEGFGGRESGGSFYSDARRRGFVLSIFLELFGDDEAVKPLVDQVAEDLEARDASGYTTQELVWGVSGLGKWYRSRAAEAVGEATLRAGGAEVEPAAASGSFGEAWQLPRASEYESLALEVDEAEADQLHLVVSSEGVRENPTTSWEDEGLSLERSYRNRQGETLSFDGHRLGDMAYVRLEVTNTTGEDLQNVALVDRIPAGWEIENPRLSGKQQPDWVDEGTSWKLDHMNVRDDRFEAFGDIGEGETVTVVYAARATLAGEYAIPPARIEAMYDPSIRGRVQGDTIAIGGPWEDLIN